MKRSVAVASALAADPSVLVLDEPINGLEVAAVRRVKGVLRDHAARGGTVLLTSHVLAEMEPIADMVMVLDSGHIVSHEETDRYLGRLPNNVTEVRADDSMRLLTALIERGYAATLGKGGRIRVDGADPPAVARCARDVDVLVVELMAARRTLEDVFFASHSDQSDLLGDAIPRKDEAA
jgi:ABC-2 type transport system ATP-binding protein